MGKVGPEKFIRGEHFPAHIGPQGTDARCNMLMSICWSWLCRQMGMISRPSWRQSPKPTYRPHPWGPSQPSLLSRWPLACCPAAGWHTRRRACSANSAAPPLATCKLLPAPQQPSGPCSNPPLNPPPVNTRHVLHDSMHLQRMLLDHLHMLLQCECHRMGHHLLPRLCLPTGKTWILLSPSASLQALPLSCVNPQWHHRDHKSPTDTMQAAM